MPVFTVHRGGYSTSHSDFTFTRLGPSKSTLLHSANMTFFVRLHSRMLLGDRVEVQFSNISTDVGKSSFAFLIIVCSKV